MVFLGAEEALGCRATGTDWGIIWSKLVNEVAARGDMEEVADVAVCVDLGEVGESTWSLSYTFRPSVTGSGSLVGLCPCNPFDSGAVLRSNDDAV